MIFLAYEGRVVIGCLVWYVELHCLFPNPKIMETSTSMEQPTRELHESRYQGEEVRITRRIIRKLALICETLMIVSSAPR